MISASSRGGLHAHQLERGARRGVHARGPADDADRHRHFQRADQVALAVFAPGAQRGVAPAARGVGVRPGFDRAPVVAGGDHHRVHAVHDALVVRGGAVGIGGGEGPGLDDPIPHLLGGILVKGQLIQPDGAARARQAPVGQVGQDAQVHPPAGDLLDLRGQAFQAVLTALAPIASRTS